MQNKIHERIKKRRKELGLSAEQVAEAIRVSRATVYRYESAEIEKIPIDILIPLAKVLQTTPGYLADCIDDWEINEETQAISERSFQNRLKQARENKKMDRKELAKKVGVTVSSISNYENGISFPKIKILYKLLSVLQVDANFLFQDKIKTDEIVNTSERINGEALLPLTAKELKHLINDTIAYIWKLEDKGLDKDELGYFSRKELLEKLKQFEKENFQELAECHNCGAKIDGGKNE